MQGFVYLNIKCKHIYYMSNTVKQMFSDPFFFKHKLYYSYSLGYREIHSGWRRQYVYFRWWRGTTD